MSGTKQSLAQIPNTVESTVRTSYIICDAQWQQEIAGPFVQKSLWITRWQQEILKPSAEPSEGFPVGSAGKESSCNAGDTGMHVLSLGWEDPLEYELATHSSTLAWNIPWAVEPGGIQSMGLWGFEHDWENQEPSEGWIPVTPKFSRSVVCCGGEPFKVAVMEIAFCL